MASTPPFAASGWSVQPPPPERDLAEATKLADQIAEQARQNPSGFADLAKAFSEDVTTRDRGGSLGGVRASQFVDEPGVLDALAQIHPGEVSRVVQTRFGLHVLLRRPPPDPIQLSGRHLVIGHDAAKWLKYRQRPGKTPDRTREQALRLARDLVERARATPAHWPQLIAEYSEHRDAANDGDIGVWATREPASSPRLIEVLAELRVGEISDPVETLLGFEIIERTPVEPRQRFAATAIRLHFNPAAEEHDPTSKRSTAALSRSIVSMVQKEPMRFASFQEKYCCAEPVRWTRGREDPEIGTIVENLPLDAVAREAVVIDNNFVILRRLDPEKLPAEVAIQFELPAPLAPNLEHLITRTAPNLLAKGTREVAQAARASLELSPDQEKPYDDLHDQLVEAFKSNSPRERFQSFEQFDKDLGRLLGRERFERYFATRDATVVKMLLRN